MAEIKSTMDLVMEKTRHLSMTEDEKAEKRREEAVGRIRGVLQKLGDRRIKFSEAEKELDSIRVSYGEDAVRIEDLLKQELFDRLDFEADNTALLKLLEIYAGTETEPFHDLFDQYRTSLDSARQDRLNELRHELAADRLISGSAIIPNPSADPEWQQMLADIKTAYARKLKEQITKAA